MGEVREVSGHDTDGRLKCVVGDIYSVHSDGKAASGTAELTFVSVEFGSCQRRSVERIHQLQARALGVTCRERPVIKREAGWRAGKHEVRRTICSHLAKSEETSV